MTRIKMHISKVKLPFYPPCEVKYGLQNGVSTDGTHSGEIRRIRNGDGKVAKDLCDNQRKDELITSCRILINIEDRSDEVRGEVKRKIL